MKRFLLLSAVLLLANLSAACGATGSSVSPITAIPADDLTAAANLAGQVAATSQVSVSPTTTTFAATSTLITTPTHRPLTATPLSNDLPAGSAREIAYATDVAMQPTIARTLSFDQNPVPIKFSEFYEGYNLRTGLILSDKLLSLDGKRIEIAGYMAPPLKPELDYFVLTRIRLAFCPFCSTGADWPDDIALVYLNGATTTATDHPVRITGQMEIGASLDQETGMVSLVRIYADTMEVIQ